MASLPQLPLPFPPPPPAPQARFIDDITTNPSAAIWNTPTFFPTTGLYNPVMVTIKLTEGETTHTFQVPQELLCTKSAYFAGAYAKGFKEGETREIELKDAKSWVVRVLISWLYTGRVFLQDEDAPSRAAKRKFDDVEDAAQDGRRVSAFASRDRAREEELAVQVETASSPTAKAIKDRGQGHMPRITTERSDIVRVANPVSWHWAWLIELYAFTDQYDTRELRMIVHDLIQLKMYSLRPLYYARPTKEDYRLLDALLPPTSGPYRLMKDAFAREAPLSFYGDNQADQIKALDGLPYHFILECMVATKAHAGAMKCHLASPESCIDAAEHKPEDRYNINLTCRAYHEHGEDHLESFHCQTKWSKLWHDYCAPNPQQQASGIADAPS